MGRHEEYPAEVPERAIRLVMEQKAEYGSEWETIESVAAKIGCTAETLRQWVRQAEKDHGQLAVTSPRTGVNSRPVMGGRSTATTLMDPLKAGVRKLLGRPSGS